MRAKAPELAHAPLGRKTTYIATYKPELLFAIPRQLQRKEIDLDDKALPFQGGDIWDAYEISWLNPKGKPMIATADFFIPCTSSHLIESKSFKLYLNSLNNTTFASIDEVKKVLAKDLSHVAADLVTVNLQPICSSTFATSLNGICLDELDIECDQYQPAPQYLVTESHTITETLYSNLFKSNCYITGQPDWACIQISYTGKKIQHQGLLKYLISFRNHEEFHEHCVERIFTDIMRECQPDKLMVYARYTRRGGLNINPYRANYEVDMKNVRLSRQ